MIPPVHMADDVGLGEEFQQLLRGRRVAEGVAVLEDYSLRAALMEAIKASYDRTVELGK